MKILIPILIVSALLLSGCDAVSDTIQKALDKGDLDGVVRCMESNANKEGLLSSDYIKKECIKEYSALTTESLNSEKCSARLLIREQYAGVEFNSCGCRNGSERIITSVTTAVFIMNIAGKTGTPLRLQNNRENLFIPPNECFDFSSISYDLEEKDWGSLPDVIPYCSDLDPGEIKVCKSWGIPSFGYLRTNIR